MKLENAVLTLRNSSEMRNGSQNESKHLTICPLSRTISSSYNRLKNDIESCVQGTFIASIFFTSVPGEKGILQRTEDRKINLVFLITFKINYYAEKMNHNLRFDINQALNTDILVNDRL